MFERNDHAFLNADAAGVDPDTGMVGRPAPGKVTLTSRLPPSRELAAHPLVPPAPSRSVFRSEDPFAMHMLGDEAPALDEALARGGGGSPLPDEVRLPMEQAFHHDFSSVRVHTDGAAAAAAAAIGARAFTTGHDIYFAAGAFSTGDDGRRLLAHELAHVVQHGQGRTGATPDRTQISRPDDALEREAEHRADEVMRRAPSIVAGGPAHGERPAAAATAGGGAARNLFRFAERDSDRTYTNDGDHVVLISGSGPADVAAGFIRGPALGPSQMMLVIYGRTATLFDRGAGAAGTFHFRTTPALFPGVFMQAVGQRSYGVLLRGPDRILRISSPVDLNTALDLRSAFVEQAAFDTAARGHALILIVPETGGGGRRGSRPAGAEGGGGGGGRRNPGTPGAPGTPGTPGAPGTPGTPGTSPGANGPRPPAPVPAGEPHTPHPPSPNGHSVNPNGHSETPHPPPVPGRPTAPNAPAPRPGQPAPPSQGTAADRDQHGSAGGTRESGAPGQGGTRQTGAPTIATPNGYNGPGQRGDEPAFPARIEGPALVPVGADASYDMRVDHSWAGAGPGEVISRVNGVNFRWERYRVEHSEEIEGTLRTQNGQESAEAGVLANDRGRHTGNDGATAGAAVLDDARRTWHNVNADTRRAQDGLAGAVRGDGHRTAGQRASAVLANLVSVSTSNLSTVVRMAGVLGRALGNSEITSRSIHFDGPGVYVVRCVAQPRHSRRVASVAIRVVRVENIDSVARNALDQPRRDLSDTETQLATGQGNAAELTARRDNLRIEVGGSTVEVLTNRITQLRRRQQESGDAGFRAALQHEIDELGRQVAAANANNNTAPGQHLYRLRAAFADRESGQSYPLLLQMNTPSPEGSRYRAAIVDVTTPQITRGEETSDDLPAAPSDPTRRAAQQQAIWRACRELAGQINLGRGRMIVHMPADAEGPFVAGDERIFDVEPTDWALARTRLEDVATAASMIALVVPGAQAIAIVGGIAGGVAAAQRLWNRSESHSLSISDPSTLADIFSVISAIAQVPGMVGNARVFNNGGRLAVAVRTLARGAEMVDTAANWVGFAVNTGETLDSILRLNARERAGEITHNEAAIQRNQLLLGLMRDSAMQVVSPPEHGEHATPQPHGDPAAAPRPAHVDPPAAGHVPVDVHPHGDPPTAGHVDPPTAGHVDPPATGHVDPPAAPPAPHVAPPSGNPPQGGGPSGGPAQPPPRGLPMRLSGRPHDNNQLSGNTHLSAPAARAEHARRGRMDHDRTAAQAAIARELPHSTGMHENGWMSRPSETTNVIPVDSPSAPSGVEHQIYDPPTARGTRPEPLSHSIAVGNGDYVHQVATGERVTVTTPLGPDGQPGRHDILRSTGFCSCAGIAVRARGPHGESLTIGHAAAADAGVADGGQYSRLTGEVTRALDAHATDVAVFANIDRTATGPASRADLSALHSFPADTASLLIRMRNDVAAHLGPTHTVTVERGGLVIVGPDGVRRTVAVGVQLRPVPPGPNASPSMSALQVTGDGILVTNEHGGATHWSWDALPGPYLAVTPNQGMPPPNNGGTPPPAHTPPSGGTPPPGDNGGTPPPANDGLAPPTPQPVPPMNQSEANALEVAARQPAPAAPPRSGGTGLAQLGAGGGAVASDPAPTPNTAHASGPGGPGGGPTPPAPTPPPRVEHLLESGPLDQSWTLTIEGNQMRLSREHPPVDMPLPATVPAQEEALIRAGVRRPHAVAMVREIIRHRGVAQDRLYVSYAANNATAREHVINTVTNQQTGMSATTGPLNLDRRRSLVVNHTAARGGDPLSSFAVVYAELPSHPFTHQPPRQENINGQTIARPGESEYRPGGGARQVANVEALGAIEVDDAGNIVEIVGYSSHITGGHEGFLDLLRQQGWPIQLRTPPAQPPEVIRSPVRRDPR